MFRIAKQDAEEFWKANFGERIIVNWSEFVFKLNRVHKISSPSESYSLKETIQLTKSKHVSIFEFDIFTRLFQPWSNLLNNWKFLVTEHPAYCAFSTYDEVHKRLQKHINKPGSYLFRLSCTKLGQWAIGYVTTDHKILQTIPQSLIQALIDGQKQSLYLYPDGRDINIDISSAIAVTSASRIQISKEQHDMYLDMGTLFQVCKICSENNKDRKLEPCGHLICSTCLENWQDLQTTPSCPFCRCEIKTFEPIIITPFEEKSNQKYNLNLNQTNETEVKKLI
jgi:E3 ubiquitin-protein ligase CBL